MKAGLSFFTAALLASSVVAVPTKSSRLARRLARRSATRSTHPLIPVAGPAPKIEAEGSSSNETETEYSQNWAGAVYTTAPAGATYTAVSASFTVPQPKATSGSSSGASSAWVGIDGDTCGSAILQTGVDMTINNGEPSYDAWYEWYPDYAYDFNTFDFSAGDVILASVVSSSNKKGVAQLENLSTGQKVSKTLSAPSASGTLCGTNIETIVEDFEEGSSLVPLANFGTVVFEGATGKLSNGKTMDFSGADTIDIRQNGKTLTDVSVSGNKVTVKYTGS